MYFSRPDEADRTYRAFAELAVGRPCQYTAHMRNAATRQFTLCEVAAAPSPDGKTACGTVTPKQ